MDAVPQRDRVDEEQNRSWAGSDLLAAYLACHPQRVARVESIYPGALERMVRCWWYDTYDRTFVLDHFELPDGDAADADLLYHILFPGLKRPISPWWLNGEVECQEDHVHLLPDGELCRHTDTFSLDFHRGLLDSPYREKPIQWFWRLRHNWPLEEYLPYERAMMLPLAWLALPVLAPIAWYRAFRGSPFRHRLITLLLMPVVSMPGCVWVLFTKELSGYTWYQRLMQWALRHDGICATHWSVLDLEIEVRSALRSEEEMNGLPF